MATAMDVYEPFDAGAGANVTEDGWRAMMRRGNIAGVVKGASAELLPFADSSGMQVKFAAGEVVIEGYWGQSTGTKIVSVAANASGSTRYDLMIARADWSNNVVELAVVTGTPGAGKPPDVTRDTTKWEIPIGVVKVINGAATIAGADISDARQWGGPPVATVTDDFLLWQDKLSTCARFNVTGDNAVTNNNLYIARLHSLGEQTCSEIRLCPTVLPVGGTTTVRIFRGYRQDLLGTFIDPTTSTFLYGGTAGAVHVSAIPTTTFRAGETIVIAVAGAGTSTAATLASNAVTFTGNASTFLNPVPAPMVTAFKPATMPTSLNLLDGSWGKRDRLFWAALA